MNDGADTGPEAGVTEPVADAVDETPSRASGSGGRRILFGLVGFLVIVLLGAGFRAVQENREGDTLAEYAAGELEVRETTPAFTARFPTEPVRETQTETAGDLRLETVSFTSQITDGVVVVGYTDYPPELTGTFDVRELLRAAARNNVSRFDEGRITKTTELTMFGEPALEINGVGVNGEQRIELVARVFLKGQRIFFLEVQATTPQPEAAEKFFRSFELPDEPVNPAGS